jgi:hypothetical protein
MLLYSDWGNKMKSVVGFLYLKHTYYFVVVDVPHMRQADIRFALTVVLHAMCPPASKTAPVTAQNIKTASEMRTGSLTYSGRSDKKKQQKIPVSLMQVAFLGKFQHKVLLKYRVSFIVTLLGKHYNNLIYRY